MSLARAIREYQSSSIFLQGNVTMPTIDGVGYSESTKIKIMHLEKIFEWHLAVTQAVLNKYAKYRSYYRYVDLTAGKGCTPDGTKGSPIVFLEHAESSNFTTQYKADFIECNPQNLDELKVSISTLTTKQGWPNRKHGFHLSEYEQAIPNLFSAKNLTELGLVFVDTSGDLPNFESLRYIAEMRPRMEILIYVSSTNVKRLHQYTDMRLKDYMDRVGKTYWLFRKPISWDKHKWTFLLGSNTNLFQDYKKIDVFRLDTKTGEEEFYKVNLTKEQQQERVQPSLFE